MPRFRRIIRPGDLVHVISRFVNGEHRLAGPDERAEYLQRFGACIRESNWSALSYALMSSHVHHAVVAGTDPFDELIKSVHAPFAGWLNLRQGRLGPVFAERPKTISVNPAFAARLIAYHHNNPPRAGVVATAQDSDWTSHRAYLSETERPPFLSVDLGLELMGFGTSASGRQAFAEYVVDRQSEPRDPMLTGDLRAARSALREELGAAVCIMHPRCGPGGLDYDPSTRVSRWEGSVADLIQMVARARGVTPLEITSASRRRDLTAARRQVALLAGMLGQSCRLVGLHLGISEAAVRKLRKLASESARNEAQLLVQQLGAAI